jgi:hypothetical protein
VERKTVRKRRCRWYRGERRPHCFHCCGRRCVRRNSAEPATSAIQTAIERFRATIPANFDPEYVEKVVVPFFLTSVYEGERPMLPIIDVNLSKEN